MFTQFAEWPFILAAVIWFHQVRAVINTLEMETGNVNDYETNDFQFLIFFVHCRANDYVDLMKPSEKISSIFSFLRELNGGMCAHVRGLFVDGVRKTQSFRLFCDVITKRVIIYGS